MLKDPKAFAFMSSFAHQWLHMERLDFFQFDYRQYPEFDESVKEAARGEVFETIRSIITEGLAPLARHKEDITVIQNLANQFSNEAHWGSTFWLTGANRYAEPGQSFNNSVSADQVAAETLGQETRFPLDSAGSERRRQFRSRPGAFTGVEQTG